MTFFFKTTASNFIIKHSWWSVRVPISLIVQYNLVPRLHFLFLRSSLEV